MADTPVQGNSDPELRHIDCPRQTSEGAGRNKLEWQPRRGQLDMP